MSSPAPDPPPKRRRSFGWAGPGLIMAASGIGASDIVSATVGGATHGFALLWALLVGTFFKFVLSEGLARWQLATGTTLLEGWAKHLPRWVMILFAIYLVLWSIAVSGALVSGCGLAVETLSHGFIPRTWGGFGQAILAFLLIRLAGGSALSRFMKPLITVMFVTVVSCAVLTFHDPSGVLRGLSVPTIPDGAGAFVLSLIGGIGGSLSLLGYNYLLRDKGRVDASNLRAVRRDLAAAYLFTAVFGISVMLIASRVFHSAGVAITDREAITRMAEALAEQTGRVGFYFYSLGFWAAVTASLLGVWQSIPGVITDCHRLLRKQSTEASGIGSKSNSFEWRAALAFMALASVPFAFVGRPLVIIIAFTVLGSLFIPFLAATLLYLNTRVTFPPPLRSNRAITNVVLGVILVLFLVVGGIEIASLMH